MNYLDLIHQIKKKHDLDTFIGTAAKAVLIMKLNKEFEHPNLKVKLKECNNLTQMINTIEQTTGLITRQRTTEEMYYFKSKLRRIILICRI